MFNLFKKKEPKITSKTINDINLLVLEVISLIFSSTKQIAISQKHLLLQLKIKPEDLSKTYVIELSTVVIYGAYITFCQKFSKKDIDSLTDGLILEFFQYINNSTTIEITELEFSLFISSRINEYKKIAYPNGSNPDESSILRLYSQFLLNIFDKEHDFNQIMAIKDFYSSIRTLIENNVSNYMSGKLIPGQLSNAFEAAGYIKEEAK